MKTELLQSLMIAAFFVALTGVFYEFNEMERKNAYQQGRLDAQQEQLEYLKGKDK